MSCCQSTTWYINSHSSKNLPKVVKWAKMKNNRHITTFNETLAWSWERYRKLSGISVLGTEEILIVSNFVGTGSLLMDGTLFIVLQIEELKCSSLQYSTRSPVWLLTFNNCFRGQLYKYLGLSLDMLGFL